MARKIEFSRTIFCSVFGNQLNVESIRTNCKCLHSFIYRLNREEFLSYMQLIVYKVIHRMTMNVNLYVLANAIVKCQVRDEFKKCKHQSQLVLHYTYMQTTS